MLLSPKFFTLPLNLALAAVLGYTGVAAGLRIWRPLPELPTPLVAEHTSALMAAPRQISVQPIVEAYLFGRPAAKPEARAEPAAAPPEAPETALNFKLHGILHSSEASGMRAVIQVENGATQVFQPGAEIAPGVTLHTLYPDRALLLRNGRYETLSLEGSEAGAKEALLRHVPGPASAAPASGDPGKLAVYREEVLQHPERMSRYLRLRPLYRDGQLSGYTLAPGREAGLLQEFGLQAGDVVTAVNGTRLDSPMNGLNVLQQLAAASQIQLDLERNGMPLSLSFSLPPLE